ncbi:MAG: hypothetical protein BWK79_16090 [Beggiatoa sp. IS2]|nr:MAG: hypothetical protein BWK79_16090 [Beggiatoa sp. IS2]
MTKNLLALLLALQKATLDADTQHYLLPQLGSKLEAISQKSHPNEQDWHNVQTKINDILDRNPLLAAHYQQFSLWLQTWTDEGLRTLLPSPEQRKLFDSKSAPTLGYTPGDFPPNSAELENLIVDVSQLILRYKNPAKASRELLSECTINLKLTISKRC